MEIKIDIQKFVNARQQAWDNRYDVPSFYVERDKMFNQIIASETGKNLEIEEGNGILFFEEGKAKLMPHCKNGIEIFEVIESQEGFSKTEMESIENRETPYTQKDYLVNERDGKMYCTFNSGGISMMMGAADFGGYSTLIKKLRKKVGLLFLVSVE